MNISGRAKYLMVLSCFIIIVAATVTFNGCKSNNRHQSNVPDSTVADDDLNAQQLVARYCTKCHAATPPDLLTKDVWNYHTLPSMAPYAGIAVYGNSYFKKDTVKRGISIVNWHRIVDYYLNAAPVALAAQKRPDPLVNDMAGFEVKLPKQTAGINTAFTTAVTIDSITHQLYSADAATLKVYKWSKELKAAQVANVLTPVVHIMSQKDVKGGSNKVLTSVGLLEPNNYPNGRVLSGDLQTTGQELNIIETDLFRPVHTSGGDLNKDGLTDYVISANGGVTGSLIWMKQNAGKTFTRNIIKKPSGPVQTLIGDFNNDSWPDIMVLYGSGNEGLSIFFNDKRGGFKERELLHFPPTYGSSSFQLTDVNHDGKPDLIYSCGYNFRDSRILKPYTGLYIYINSGNWNFKQKYFYPINGCTKAIAADFDGDGDIDIATSAFFADLINQPAESFIYFEQNTPMHFKPHAIPVSKYGRWFSMDVGDVNGDGKPDIVLGNYSKGLTIEANQNLNNNGNIPLIVLENHIKQ